MNVVKLSRTTLPLLGLMSLAALAHSAATVGAPAPDFTLTDANGKTHSLKDFRGKIVVLEWTNYGCPFVKKHYGAGSMQKLQSAFTKKGVVWLSINSSNVGNQGYFDASQLKATIKDHKISSTAYLLDTDGTVGHLYGAKTTPHMFVVDRNGVVAYNGAIDNQPSPDPSTLAGAKNYVSAALKDLLAGRAVETTSTQPYGCSVKY